MRRPGLIALIFSISLPALAGISPLRLEVECRSKSTGAAQAPGQPPVVKTQTQTLIIKLLNMSKEPLSDITVKYWFFARNVGSQDVTVFKEGEAKKSLEKGERKTVESEEVTSNYSSSGIRLVASGPNRAPTTTRVAATGQRLTGYAVKVFSGDKVIGEHYSESSYKQKINAPPPKK